MQGLKKCKDFFDFCVDINMINCNNFTCIKFSKRILPTKIFLYTFLASPIKSFAHYSMIKMRSYLGNIR